MNYRQFGRTEWQISEIGYGMWGMGGWSNSDDQESLESLQAAVDLGVNFFDTAYVYGEGRSENFSVRWFARILISGCTPQRRFLPKTSNGQRKRSPR
jgi:aryl-alcohol dehydrogenase-like predicted oxidoreductase